MKPANVLAARTLAGGWIRLRDRRNTRVLASTMRNGAAMNAAIDTGGLIFERATTGRRARLRMIRNGAATNATRVVGGEILERAVEGRRALVSVARNGANTVAANTTAGGLTLLFTDGDGRLWRVSLIRSGAKMVAAATTTGGLTRLTPGSTGRRARASATLIGYASAATTAATTAGGRIWLVVLRPCRGDGAKFTWNEPNTAAGFTVAGCRRLDENLGRRENRVSCTRIAYGMNGTPTAAVIGAEILHWTIGRRRVRVSVMSGGRNTIAAAWFGGGGRSLLCGNRPCLPDGANRISNGGKTTAGATTLGGRSATLAFRPNLEARTKCVWSAENTVGTATTTGPPIAYLLRRPVLEDFAASLICSAAAMNGTTGGCSVAGGRSETIGFRANRGDLTANVTRIGAKTVGG